MTTPTMAAWWREGGLHYGQRPPPQLARPDEVSVRVVLTGICRTDVALAAGWLPCPEPRVLGHEVAGLVESVGPRVTRWRPGDRVAVRPLIPGPTGRERLGQERDGGFAELLVVPETALVRVPDRLDWRRAAYVEPVAAALAITRAPLAGTVGVVGEGRIAELTRRVLAAMGFTPARGGGLDVAIDTGGTTASLEQAMARVREGGLVVLKGRPPAPIAFDMTTAVLRELRFHAVGWAPFEEAFALLGSPDLPVDDLLGPVQPLAALGELLAQADERTKYFVTPLPGGVGMLPGTGSCVA